MPVEWTNDLATGSDEIDDQHKELFKRVNNLLDGCKHGKGKEEVAKILRFLDDYVITHFSTEETFMQQHNYPGYSDHKARHLEFIKNFSGLKEKFEKEGPGVHLVVIANHLVVEWLQNHIRKVDRALGAFLKTKA